MSKNVQNIQQSHKLHHESHEKLESGICSRRTNCSISKNPKSNFPEDSLLPLNYIHRKGIGAYKCKKSQDIEMEFGIGTCAIQTIKKGKEKQQKE